MCSAAWCAGVSSKQRLCGVPALPGAGRGRGVIARFGQNWTTVMPVAVAAPRRWSPGRLGGGNAVRLYRLDGERTCRPKCGLPLFGEDEGVTVGGRGG